MDVTVVALLVLCFLAFGLWGQMMSYRAQAFKWRKRWIIERFQIGVEGNEGDYFVLAEYVNNVPCLVFAKRPESLVGYGRAIRQWNSMMGVHLSGPNGDVPDETGIGLPANPKRDDLNWVSAGIGLCPLPMSVHEKYQQLDTPSRENSKTT